LLFSYHHNRPILKSFGQRSSQRHKSFSTAKLPWDWAIILDDVDFELVDFMG
jgi:hypothetical protein